MNKNAESRARRLFAGVNSSLSRTDPEFVEIISNFSQDETANANILTEKERMLCILAALLGCQGMGEFQNMLHAALNIGVDPVAIKETIRQRPILGSAAPVIFSLLRTGLWSSMASGCHLRRKHPQMRNPGLSEGLPNRWSCLAPIWRSAKRMARRFAETLTAGWRTTALETIIPATA